MERQYVGITLENLDEAGKDLATGLLSELGYDGFEDGPDGFSAFIDASAFDEAGLAAATQMLGVGWRKNIILEENWNALWENSFKPVVIPGKVAVRADFHSPVEGVTHEVIITPKMSFGTGHHATTWMMMDMMFGIGFEGLNVLDFGAGTGILAILAEKMGASQVDAVDHDPWCIHNMEQNLHLNRSNRVKVVQSDRIPAGQTYDIVLANINRNFLLEHARGLGSLLRPGGKLLLSGFLEEDVPDLTNAYLSLETQVLAKPQRNKWAGLALQYREPLTT
jgi:ribosomal protein L11 methyltransferase